MVDWYVSSVAYAALPAWATTYTVWQIITVWVNPQITIV